MKWCAQVLSRQNKGRHNNSRNHHLNPTSLSVKGASFFSSSKTFISYVSCEQINYEMNKIFAVGCRYLIIQIGISATTESCMIFLCDKNLSKDNFTVQNSNAMNDEILVAHHYKPIKFLSYSIVNRVVSSSSFSFIVSIGNYMLTGHVVVLLLALWFDILIANVYFFVRFFTTQSIWIMCLTALVVQSFFTTWTIAIEEGMDTTERIHLCQMKLRCHFDWCHNNLKKDIKNWWHFLRMELLWQQ